MEESLSLQNQDAQYMQKALDQASLAFAQDEVPIGAVVVERDGTLIGAGYNLVEAKKTQQAHAEMLALNQAVQFRNDWRLDGCTLYVTLEPCSMCIGLIRLSRISRVVYAADSPLFGYHLDNQGDSWVYKNDIEIRAGVAADEARQLLKQFFQKKRKKKGE